MPIVEFLPGRLYGGGHLDEKGWQFVRHRGINAIINVSDKREKPPANLGNRLIVNKLLDNDDPPKLPWVPETMGLMNQLLGSGHVLYVHDTAGHNRLGFLLTAYYMQRFGLSRDEALRALRQKKADLKPNKKYIALLGDYEAYLRSHRG